MIIIDSIEITDEDIIYSKHKPNKIPDCIELEEWFKIIKPTGYKYFEWEGKLFKFTIGYSYEEVQIGYPLTNKNFHSKKNY